MAMRNMEDIHLVMLGCGNMAGAMLMRWLDSGLSLAQVTIVKPTKIDPASNARLAQIDYAASLNALSNNQKQAFESKKPFVILGLKPNQFHEIYDDCRMLLAYNPVFVSLAAGIKIETMAAGIGQESKLIRTMPNTPSQIGDGVTGLFANQFCSADEIQMTHDLLSLNGLVCQVHEEALIDVVTALSGSGPAYVYALIEAMAEAAIQMGLPAALANQMALKTVSGTAKLAQDSALSPTQLRQQVTSKNGTTEAALKILRDSDSGLSPLMAATMKACHQRALEIANI